MFTLKKNTFRFLELESHTEEKSISLIIYDVWIGVKHHVFIPDFHHFSFIQLAKPLVGFTIVNPNIALMVIAPLVLSHLMD